MQNDKCEIKSDKWPLASLLKVLSFCTFHLSLFILHSAVVFAMLLFATANKAQGQSALTPFLKQHCFDCHSGDEPEGGLDLQTTEDGVSLRPCRWRRDASKVH